MQSVELIRALSSAFGPPGFEEDVLEAAKKYVPPGYITQRDSLLNFYMQREPIPGAPTVMLDAHSDEVGLMVHAIKSDGTIVFTALGGWVPAALVAQRMLVRNRDGKLVTGVVASKAPHFGGTEEAPPKLEQLVLDLGARSKEEVLEEYKIAPGCAVVPKSEFEQRGDLMIGKAFDDRLGCAAVLEVLAEARDVNVNLVGTFSTQEEVGLRGAKVSARRVRPDIAICLEGAPADDTLCEPQLTQTALGRGPMLRHFDRAMITNPRFLRFALDVAERQGIPVQEAVRTGGSTNGASIHLANLGVPTIVIACPVRYAHSHNGMASLSDYSNMVALAVEIVKAIDTETIQNF